MSVTTYLSLFNSSLTVNLVQEIIKTAFENGINMFDEAEAYEAGNSEKELLVSLSQPLFAYG